MMFAGGLSDPDAVAYIAAVQAVSGMPYGNQLAVNAFIAGCKADGIWSAIKASCILAGANDLTGALVPLVGTAPTNNGFVSGDYSRTLGLLGDGATKYLNTNRNNNADPQNSKHLAVFCTGVGVAAGSWLAAGGGDPGGSGVNRSSNTRCNHRNVSTGIGGVATGFSGVSRASSANYQRRANSIGDTVSQVSEAPADINIVTHANAAASGVLAYSNSRLSFHSIGEAVDLALLDARLTTLMGALT